MLNFKKGGKKEYLQFYEGELRALKNQTGGMELSDFVL